MKRIFLIGMLLSQTALLHAATETVVYDGIEYIIDITATSNTAIAWRVVEPERTSFEIPEQFYCNKGILADATVPVIGMSESLFYENDVVETVVLPPSVKKIGTKAFYKCTSLKEVYTSGATHAINTQQIGNAAFAYCHSLERLNIGGNVQVIYGDIFGDTVDNGSVPLYPNLKEITFEPGYDLEIRESHDDLVWTKPAKTRDVKALGNKYEIHLDKLKIARNIKTIDMQIPTVYADVVDIDFYTIPEIFSEYNKVSTPNLKLSYENLFSLDLDKLQYFEGLENLYCTQNTPPVLNYEDNETSQMIFDNVNLYVPLISYEVYKEATGWKNFKEIIPSIVNGVGDIPPSILEGTYKAETYRLDENGNKIDYVTNEMGVQYRTDYYWGDGRYWFSDPLDHEGYYGFLTKLNDDKFTVTKSCLLEYNKSDYARFWDQIDIIVHGGITLEFDVLNRPVIKINDWEYKKEHYGYGEATGEREYFNQHSYTTMTYLNSTIPASASVDSLSSDENEGEEVWYDMSGIVVRKSDVMPAGIYIVAKGSKRTKVLIK